MNEVMNEWMKNVGVQIKWYNERRLTSVSVNACPDDPSYSDTKHRRSQRVIGHHAAWCPPITAISVHVIGHVYQGDKTGQGNQPTNHDEELEIKQPMLLIQIFIHVIVHTRDIIQVKVDNQWIARIIVNGEANEKSLYYMSHWSFTGPGTISPFEYERMYLPLYKVAHTASQIQGDELCYYLRQIAT